MLMRRSNVGCKAKAKMLEASWS